MEIWFFKPSLGRWYSIQCIGRVSVRHSSTKLLFIATYSITIFIDVNFWSLNFVFLDPDFFVLVFIAMEQVIRRVHGEINIFG
jgi:hypothetical protein